MKDLRKVNPKRIQILQEIDLLSMEIDVAIIGFEMLTSVERKQIHSKIEQLYTKRSSLQQRLRTIQ